MLIKRSPRLYQHNGLIPKWIFNSIYSKLENPDLLKNQDINVMIVNLSPINNPQVIAYANVGSYDSVFIIYEKVDNEYKQVFYKKSWFISSVEVTYPNVILKILEESGTGFATFNFYVIRNTTKGYKQVWSGTSHKYEIFPREFNYEIICGLNSYFNDGLIHFTVKNDYKGMDTSKPIKTIQSNKIYTYNESSLKYE